MMPMEGVYHLVRIGVWEEVDIMENDLLVRQRHIGLRMSIMMRVKGRRVVEM